MTDFTPNETMLNNYIQNKLSDAQTEQVELWLADNSDVLQDLQLDLMLKHGLTHTEEKAIKQKPKSFSFLDFFTSKKLVPLHLLAYGLVGFLLFNNINTQHYNPNTAATFIELEKQRGLNDSIIEVQTGKNQSLVLRFFPDSMTEKYSLVMQSKSSNKKIEFKDLIADDYGSITVSINNKENIVGEWEVFIFSANTYENKQEYSILFSVKYE